MIPAIVRKTLDTIVVGEPTVHRNLTIFPLLGEDLRESPGYLLLEEAVPRQTFSIREISESGEVSTLCAYNTGPLPVLILDGVELIGAKQNRVANLTVMVPAHSTVELPVSCVEAGRWRSQSTEFRPAAHAQYAEGRASRTAQVTRSMRATGAPLSDQIEVWIDLKEKSTRLGTHSATDAMMAMYLDHAPRVEEYAQAFPARPYQRGVLFAINGVARGVDLFDHSRTLRSVLPALIRGYALDAIDRGAGKADSPAPNPDGLLDHIRQAKTAVSPGVGMGEDLRLHAKGLAGGALHAFGGLVHLFGFAEVDSGARLKRQPACAHRLRRFLSV